jgi:hypothetical protein
MNALKGIRQLYRKTGYRLADLTEGKLHRIEEENGSFRYYACFPKKWRVVDGPKVTAIDGNDYHFYDILEWEEVELEPKDSK